MSNNKTSNSTSNTNNRSGSADPTPSDVNKRRRALRSASDRTAVTRQRTRSATSTGSDGGIQPQWNRIDNKPVRIRTRNRPAGDEVTVKHMRLPSQPPQGDEGALDAQSTAPAAAPDAPPAEPARPKAVKKRKGGKHKNQKPLGDYEVGYRKPPRHTRFQPGQSGNPKGRPKNDKQQAAEEDMFIRVLFEIIPITEQGQKMEVTKLEGLVRGQIMAALSGKPTAVKHLGALWELSKRLNSRPKNVEITTEELDLLRSVFGDGEFKDRLEDGSPDNDDQGDE